MPGLYLLALLALMGLGRWLVQHIDPDTDTTEGQN